MGRCQEAEPDAWSTNHMFQVPEECWLSDLASQNVSPPGHSNTNVSRTFGRKEALVWGLLISHVSLKRSLCMSKHALYTVSLRS